MANFIAIVDPNPERRQRFLETVRSEIAPVDSLRIDSVAVGDFGVVWAAHESAPVSTAWSDTAASVLWGEAIPGPGPRRIDATTLFGSWEPNRWHGPAAFDGFYAAVRYFPNQGLMAGSDLLGLFPVYYAAHTDTVIVGSSPELFRRHPSFPAKLSCKGLAGLLLLHAPLDGHGLLAGVQRLRPGHVLRWRDGSGATEILQYAIPVPSRDDRGSYADQIALLDSIIESAVSRHLPENEDIGILLSGGTDTRQLLSYMRGKGRTFHALTMGDSTDYEMGCAKAVARRLRMEHLVRPLDHAKLPAGAELQAKWEQLGSGFSTPHMWSVIEPLRELPSRVVSGYLWGDIDPMPAEFDELVRSSNLHGIPAATLGRLLRPDLFDEMIGTLETRMKELYEESCEVESQRPWRFVLDYNWRIHAGGVPWKMSFGSWPVLPILDRAVLEAVFTLLHETLADRRAQHETIRRRAPDLARLPLDRNTHNTLPIDPSPWQWMRHGIRMALEPVRRRMPGRTERRYYHRIYDINNPGWLSVRRMAEPHRDRVAELFNMDVLRELVPSPDTNIAVEHKIRDSYGTKQLIGLMLWSADHLS